jgi:lipopolysaccharide transport system ATP-binding protein
MSRSEIAIRAEGLGKMYHIGSMRRGYRTLRDSISDTAKSPFRAVRSVWRGTAKRRSKEKSLLWALRNIDLEIRRGDVVGIIGRNGAGKSTLLKVLSRITEPSEGYAEVHGRVGSLLEVGTGFHPELTGRENIFLNGAILGMRRFEIQRKFDAIVDFAGVERFIDTAVKHYSSGMYLRLAFAVAAHLEPQILLVDEVLAVGDAAFQKRCLGRMEAVAQDGRTVLFVSHNMGAVRSLCRKGIVLGDGKVEAAGDVHDCIARYFHAIGALQDAPDEAGELPGGTGFRRVVLHGNRNNTVEQGEPFELSTAFRLEHEAAGFYLFCILEDMHGHNVFHLQEASPDLGIHRGKPGDYHIRVKLPALWLVPGLYAIHFKAMLWGQSGSRYLSDKFPLDVEGTSSSSNHANVLLHPRVAWDIRQPALTTEGT